MIDVAELKRLGFSRGTVSEALLSLSVGSEINVAPMGVKLGRATNLAIKVYSGCRTYDLVRCGARDYVINITSDPTLFYYAILSKNLLKLNPSRYVRAPRVAGCEAYVECELSYITYGRGYLKLYLRPIHIEYKKIVPKAFCRAYPAIIEALICYTKIPYLKSAGKLREAEALLNKIRSCVEVVKHSTRSRKLRFISRKVLDEAEKLI